MNRFISTILLLTVISISAAFAQGKGNGPRAKWMHEMKQTKLEYMSKELSIKPDQKAKFTEIYNAMQAELDKLHTETNSMRRNVQKNENATDLEYEKAAEALFEFKLKEGTIEKKYFEKFKTVLTPQQLFLFKRAEKKWMKELMKHRKKR